MQIKPEIELEVNQPSSEICQESCEEFHLEQEHEGRSDEIIEFKVCYISPTDEISSYADDTKTSCELCGKMYTRRYIAQHIKTHEEFHIKKEKLICKLTPRVLGFSR